MEHTTSQKTNVFLKKFGVSCLISLIVFVALAFLLILALIGIGSGLTFSQIGEKTYPKDFYKQKEYSFDEIKPQGVPLSKSWEITAEGFIDIPPLYQNSIVLLKSDQTIWAIDEYGSKLWQYTAGTRIQDVLINEGVVIFNTFAIQSPLIAIDLYTGHLLWQSSDSARDIEIGADASIIVGWDKQNLYQSLDIRDGTVNWQYKPLNTDSRSLLVTVDASLNKVYLYDNEGSTILNSRNGTIEKHIFSSDLPFPSWATSGKLYIQETNPGKLNAIESNNNRVLWEVETPRYKNFPPIFTNSYIYLGDTTGKLVAISQHNGEILWKYPSQKENVKLVSNLAVSNSVIYGIFSDARLIGFDVKSGQILGYIQFAGVSNTLSQPTIAGIAISEDKLFVSLGYKKLYAFDIRQ